jgi:uncharacterized RDD family membrane protein YckC
MPQVAVTTPFNIFLEFEIAPFFRRLSAWVLDLIILLLFARGMKYFLHDVIFSNTYFSAGIDVVLVSMPMLFYHLVMEATFQGQSLGKKALGIRVISLEGGEPRLGQYLMRWIFRVWEWPLFFGFLYMDSYYIYLQFFAVCIGGTVVVIVIAVTNKSQRLGDIAAGTTVVDLRYRYTLADTLFKDIQDTDYKVTFPQVMRLSDRDINAIRSVIAYTEKHHRFETAHRIAGKVKSVLEIQSDLEVLDFLEKLMSDYNYLATRE